MLLAAATLAPAVAAETSGQDPNASGSAHLQDKVEVVATRIPEMPWEVPAGIEVFTGAELRQRGVTDLAGALALAAGIDIAPGGDNGPASAVPEIWGLREFDAFLLVVDNVPWGGAFNPSVATLSLRDVERVEILRGPAPVTFGGTSFSGVIHVVHTPGAAGKTYAGVRGGSFGSGGAFADLPLLSSGDWRSRLSLDADQQGYRDDRTSFTRGHAAWRTSRTRPDDSLWLNVDGAWLGQDPASPHPVENGQLFDKVPLDSNQNPEGSYLRDLKFTGSFGLDRPVGGARWGLTSSISHTGSERLRGFLEDPGAGASGAPAPARGLYEKIDQLDAYVDTHFTWNPGETVRLVTGADVLHGDATAKGADFDYDVRLDGSDAPH
ncbi:MAG TPA: TonB-dependent receptor plug domain-containing protein, partial [Candidatus Polarisedimenticolia bacterium]|nr:TonB-dependent receptor plug domain-containing protein [Candidatus Polarisedimenticolia bacterium]